MQFIPVYVISLARAADRRAAVCQHLAAHNIQYTLIDAVDGSKLSPAEIQEKVAPGISIHAGAIGCYLSHLGVYQDMVDKGLTLALVLEDDARISRRAADMLRTPVTEPDFDYCFLDCDDHDDQGPIFYDPATRQPLGGGLWAYALSGGPHTLHAYLMTGRAARQRVAHGLPITRPIDTYRHLPYEIRFAATVHPQGAWVSEHSLVSETSDRRVSAASLPLRLLRRWPLFYRLKDWLTLGSFKRRRLARQSIAGGRIPGGRQWIALPRGRDILVED